MLLNAMGSLLLLPRVLSLFAWAWQHQEFQVEQAADQEVFFRQHGCHCMVYLSPPDIAADHPLCRHGHIHLHLHVRLCRAWLCLLLYKLVHRVAQSALCLPDPDVVGPACP